MKKSGIAKAKVGVSLKANLHVCDSDNRSNDRTAEKLLEELSKGIESIRIEDVLGIEEAFAGLED